MGPRYIVNLLAVIAFIIGCSPTSSEEEPVITFTLDGRLPQDSSGYYHLELDSTKWQTIHRISGHVYEDGEPAVFFRFLWESSHYWIIDDPIGYIIDKWECHDEYGCQYLRVTPDTVYIDYFSGMEVPTINSYSYSSEEGEVNTMFAPVWTMRGDTVIVKGGYFQNDSYIYESLFVILK